MTFLIKEKLSKWERFMANLARDSSRLDQDHQLYEPEKFLLGNFKKRDDGFELSPKGIFYLDSRRKLDELAEEIQNKKIEIVKQLDIPPGVLDFIALQGRRYSESKNQLSALFSYVNSKYSDM